MWSTNGQIVANTQRQETGETLLEKASGRQRLRVSFWPTSTATLNGPALQDEGGKTYVQLNGTPKGALNSTGLQGVTDLDMVGKTVTNSCSPMPTALRPPKAVVLGNALESDTNNVAVLTAGKDSAKKIADYLDDNNLKTSSGTEWYVNYALSPRRMATRPSTRPCPPTRLVRS